MKRIFQVLLIGLTMFLISCESTPKCGSCTAAKDKDGWCEGCKVGYMKGKKITCPGCFTAKKTGGKCKTCTK